MNDERTKDDGRMSCAGTTWLAERLHTAVMRDEPEAMADVGVVRDAVLSGELGGGRQELSALSVQVPVGTPVVWSGAAMLWMRMDPKRQGKALLRAMESAGGRWRGAAKCGQAQKSCEERNAARVLTGLDAWRKSKLVYEFDQGVLAMMAGAGGIEGFPCDAFARLPEGAVFIEERGDVDSGWLVFLDVLDVEAQARGMDWVDGMGLDPSAVLCLVVVSYDGTRAIDEQPTIIPLIKGATLGEVLDAAEEMAEMVDDARGVERDGLGIAAAAYLCSSEVDVRPVAERLSEKAVMEEWLEKLNLRRHVAGELVGEAIRVDAQTLGVDGSGSDLDAWTRCEWRSNGVDGTGTQGWVFKCGFKEDVMRAAAFRLGLERKAWQNDLEGGLVYDITVVSGVATREGMVAKAEEQVRKDVRRSKARYSPFRVWVLAGDGTAHVATFNAELFLSVEHREFVGDLARWFVRRLGGVAVANSFQAKASGDLVGVGVMLGNCSREDQVWSFARVESLTGEGGFVKLSDAVGAGGFWPQVWREMLGQSEAVAEA